MPKFGLWGPTLGYVVGQMWTSYYLGRRVMRKYQLPLAALGEWIKLGLALIASLGSLGVMHALISTLPRTPLNVLGALAVFAVVYTVAVRLILREEYDYIVRALRRKAA